MPVKTYGLREVADLTFYDLTTGKPFLYMDYALTSTNEHSAETVYVLGGKGAPRRLGFDGNKQSTLTVTTQIFDWRFIALLSGASVAEGATNIFKREVLTGVTNVDSVEITLSQTPVEGTVTVFPLAEDAVAGKEETITVTDATVEITDGVAGEEYVVYYQFQSENTAEKISFKTDAFPKYCKIVGDTLIKAEKTGLNEPYQFVAGKAKPQANFTFTMASEGEASELSIVFDLFADGDNALIDYIKY